MFRSFSGSVDSRVKRTMNPTMSLVVKCGWNGILSVSLFGPNGLLDPVWCRNSKCIISNATIMNSIWKWSVKFVLVWRCLLQIHLILIGLDSVVRKGTADNRFVIPVAPQNDICPHGNKYPRNTVGIVANRFTTPIDHVCTSLYEVESNENRIFYLIY
jgi:hypothetical protein